MFGFFGKARRLLKFGANMAVTLYYDDLCPLCRNLAFLVEKTDRQIVIAPMSSEAFMEIANRGSVNGFSVDSSIVVKLDDLLLADREAWLFLLNNYTGLKGLNWLAMKIGFSHQTAGALRSLAHTVKRWCRSCSRSRSAP